MRLWDFDRVTDGKVRIKDSIGRPIGLVEGSQVYSAMFKYEHDGQKSYEIVLSTFGPDNYRTLCSITFHTEDEPGAIAQAAKFLADRNIDILNSVSLSVISRVGMIWKMLADVSYCGEIEMLREDFQNLKGSKDSSVSMIDQMDIHQSNIVHRYTQGTAPQNSKKRNVEQLRGGPVIIEDGFFKMPQEYLDALEGEAEGMPFMMVGDTESWILSMTFMRPETCLVDMKISIPDSPGSIFKVTDILSKMGINLVSVHTRVVIYYQRMALDIVADVVDCTNGVPALKRDLEERLSELKGDYNLTQYGEVEF